MQNLAPGCTGVLHFGQTGALIEAPHSLQNLALATTLVPHCGQCLAAGWPAGGAGAGLGCSEGVSALPITAPRFTPTPRPTPAPARLLPPALAASSSASAALKRV